MIIPDKKKLATMIVAHMHEAPKMAEGGEVGGDTYESLAEEIISAVKAGSAGDLAAALKAFHAECEMGEAEEDSEY